jgi:hypothetical protein
VGMGPGPGPGPLRPPTPRGALSPVGAELGAGVGVGDVPRLPGEGGVGHLVRGQSAGSGADAGVGGVEDEDVEL